MKYEVEFTSDYNDGDYLHNTIIVTEEDLVKIRSIVGKIADWKGGDLRWPKSHNWPLCEKSNKDIRNMHNLSTEEFDLMSEFIPTDPYQGECHTLVSVSVTPYVEKEYLI